MIMKIFKTVEREFQYNNSKVRDIVFVCCNNCNQEFSRTKRALDIAFKRGLKVYCSKDCELESKTVRKIAECQECGKQTSNKFCSRSCSATYHNRERRKLPRVKKQKATIKREPKELKKRVCKCGKIDYTRTRFISETCSFCSTGMMYRLLCTFKFNLKDYPDEFDFKILNEHGMFHPVKNPKGVSRDHTLSVQFGKDNQIDPRIISHPANCRLILQSENTRKGSNSNITLEELLVKIEEWDQKYGTTDQLP